MKWLYGFAVLLLVLQSNARHVRESPAHPEPSSTDALKDLFAHVKSNTDQLAKQVADQFEQVKQQNPAIQETWNSVVARVQDAFQEANARIPEAKEQAEALQVKFQDLGTLVKNEYEKISKSINESTGGVQETIANNLKGTVDHLVEDIKKTNDKIQEAVTKYQTANAEKTA